MSYNYKTRFLSNKQLLSLLMKTDLPVKQTVFLKCLNAPNRQLETLLV